MKSEIIIECKDDLTESEQNDLSTFLDCHETIKEKWTCFTNPNKKEEFEGIVKMIDEMEMDEQPELTQQQWELKAKGYNQALTELNNKLKE